MAVGGACVEKLASVREMVGAAGRGVVLGAAGRGGVLIAAGRGVALGADSRGGVLLAAGRGGVLRETGRGGVLGAAGALAASGSGASSNSNSARQFGSRNPRWSFRSVVLRSPSPSQFPAGRAVVFGRPTARAKPLAGQATPC